MTSGQYFESTPGGRLVGMQLGAQGSVVQFTIRVCSMSSERPEYWRRNAAWVFSGVVGSASPTRIPRRVGTSSAMDQTMPNDRSLVTMFGLTRSFSQNRVRD